MTIWTELARAATASGDEILLRQRGALYEIRYNGMELMSNLNHHSEDLLAAKALRKCPHPARQVLIGGLGLGFTLRAVLDHLGPEARVTVCELIPEIVAWNRGVLAPLAGHPLNDPRVRVITGDVQAHLAEVAGGYDVILMDTDNGPDLTVRPENGAIYGANGLAQVGRALKPQGLAAFWSATVSPDFEAALAGWDPGWTREDVALVSGRVDAMHHIYYAAPNAVALRLAS
ncbi:spermidine synthase [Paracoccus aminophilus]|uniref:Spermine/spermidine synthase n=1 Tax=Paracoccus aminophilus JCM 7686 TaxID=1367847 RepID=S5XQZ6_PARAH|nr:spermine/spermidine synthase [Paracoccus aminophilus]AGT07487.1 spermine/spermidine synthase [Paracoccus aminophilus JCM 7686]